MESVLLRMIDNFVEDNIDVLNDIVKQADEELGDTPACLPNDVSHSASMLLMEMLNLRTLARGLCNDTAG